MAARHVNRRNVAMVVYLWGAIGLPLSFGKAELGAEVTWTSAKLTVAARPLSAKGLTVELVARAKDETVED
eukprot:9579968-Lingulodinium_polyedra.AAC.1